MSREKLDLLHICQRYKIRVIRAVPRDGYYLLETNRGPKELHSWPRLDILRWSFAWREQMARQGFREVERFIRTREAKPYVVWRKTGFTLTDHLGGSKPVPLSANVIRRCGEATAHMHLAQQSHDLPIAADVYRQGVAHAAEEAKRARMLYDEIRLSGTMDGDRKRIARHLPPLLERLDRSAKWLESAAPGPDRAVVSHGTMGRDNWREVGNKVMLCGFYRPTLAMQQRDTATFLRELITECDNLAQGLAAVDAFLDGYEQHKPLGREEYRMLLAFLAHPQKLWKRMEHVLIHQEPVSEETLAELEQEIRIQQRLDALLLHLAHRAEPMPKGQGV